MIDNKKVGMQTITVKGAAKGCRVVIYHLNGRPIAEFWASDRQRKRDAYRYSSDESRAANVKRWINSQIEREQDRQKQRAARNAGHTLKVGDVLKSSWGYDQTNIDYYQIIELIGKQTVVIRELKQERTHDDIDRGKCIPALNEFSGEPMRKRVGTYDGENFYIKISDCQRAYYEAPLQVIAGAPVYSGHYWSSYH